MGKNKPREGIVFSTDPNFQYKETQDELLETLPIDKQRLIVTIDKKQRAGKIVTVISGFIGTADDLKQLSKLIKTHCGVGGTEKDGAILIQGEWKVKISSFLTSKGYKVK